MIQPQSFAMNHSWWAVLCFFLCHRNCNKLEADADFNFEKGEVKDVDIFESCPTSFVQAKIK